MIEHCGISFWDDEWIYEKKRKATEVVVFGIRYPRQFKYGTFREWVELQNRMNKSGTREQYEALPL